MHNHHQFDHELDRAREAHRLGNMPACRYHLLRALEMTEQRHTLRQLPIGTKVQNTDAQVWEVLYHVPDFHRVKLRLLMSQNHQEWDAPCHTRVEFTRIGCCSMWRIVGRECRPECCPGSLHHYPRNKDWTCELERELYGCNAHVEPPKPFTFADAERIMLAGGECEHYWTQFEWIKSRIVQGEHQYFHPTYKDWCTDHSDWSKVAWRRYKPEAEG